MSKKCNRCEVLKPLSEYQKHKQSKDGVRNPCKQCLKAITASKPKKTTPHTTPPPKVSQIATQEHLEEIMKMGDSTISYYKFPREFTLIINNPRLHVAGKSWKEIRDKAIEELEKKGV